MDDSFLIIERGNRKDGNVQGQLDNLQDNLVNIKSSEWNIKRSISWIISKRKII